jgi:ComF family protein
MLNVLKQFKEGLSQIIFPHTCLGCSTDVLPKDELLCIQCKTELPYTNFFDVTPNPIEKIFYGRLKVEHAAAGFFFTKESLLQHLIVQLKYRGNQEAGRFLGNLLGRDLKESPHFDAIDVIIPLPLNEKKEFKRGYNQAAIICEGIAAVWQKPILQKAVERIVFTETQTHENRIQRWQNMIGVFKVLQPELLENKHILLVDDVITTGATLESCGAEILQIRNTKLSIATVAYTL